MILAAALSAAASARAAVFYQGTVASLGTAAGSLQNSAIPDGNVGGIWNTMDLTGAGLTEPVADLKVTLNVAGGYLGDFYVYLSYDGRLVPLLNRIGVSSGNAFGSSGAGLNNVILSDAASVNIHAAGNGPLSGSYRPDGQATSPLGGAVSFSATGGSITLADPKYGFGGLDANGMWTLYFADVVAGGGNATLMGWSLDISTVPEPVNLALRVSAGGALVVAALRSHRLRKLLRR